MNLLLAGAPLTDALGDTLTDSAGEPLTTPDGQFRAGPVTLKSLLLTAGSDATTLTVYNGADPADTSDPKVTLKAPIGKTATHRFRRGIVLPAGCVVALTGTAPVAMLEIED